jgi:hypothetical protein
MQALGRAFNVIPIAAGKGLSMKECSAVSFVCTGNDTFTITVAATFAGSYATPGNIITVVYTSTATDGTAAWVKTTQAASNAVVIASGTVVFTVLGPDLPDPKCYVKCSVAAAGLVAAVTHDLTVRRTPANLAKLGA